MVVEFLARFSKDLDSISQQNIRQQLSRIILHVESISSIKEIHNLKKLSGFKNAYRIRIGDYRLGLFIEGNKVQFARIAHRKDIYKLFP